VSGPRRPCLWWGQSGHGKAPTRQERQHLQDMFETPFLWPRSEHGRETRCPQPPGGGNAASVSARTPRRATRNGGAPLRGEGRERT